MYTALKSKSDHAMPLEFFHDLLDEHFAESDTVKQIETAVNWGRYAQIFTYHPEGGRLRLREDNPAGSGESISLH
jgi:NitT/TauT family transport system ATP-binding protein